MRSYDPVDQVVSIVNLWEDSCGTYLRENGERIARPAYLEWTTKHCRLRPASANLEMAKMLKSDRSRLIRTEGALAIRLLYGWRKERGDTYFAESDVLESLKKALRWEEIKEKTEARLILALARFGLVDREVGVRGKPTKIRLSMNGAALYEAFCLRCRSTNVPLAAE